MTYRIIRNRCESYIPYFTESTDYCYCNDVPGFISSLLGDYDADNFMLFLDGSVTGLKVALLKFDGSIPPIPVAQWMNAKECYTVVVKVMDDLKHSTEQWKVCADFKVSLFFYNIFVHIL